jgi:outer membrane protein assembly factor BamE (lipoprotein component of BamABCDE complex)
MLLTIFTSTASGCFVLGANKNYHPFDSDALQKIQTGQTTAQDICRIFGAPTEVVEMSNGNAYIYYRSLSKGTLVWLLIVSFGNYDKQTDQVVFFFDNDDLLTHYGVSLNADKSSYGFPF